jgi:hypothetical protein
MIGPGQTWLATPVQDGPQEAETSRCESFYQPIAASPVPARNKRPALASPQLLPARNWKLLASVWHGRLVGRKCGVMTLGCPILPKSAFEGFPGILLRVSGRENTLQFALTNIPPAGESHTWLFLRCEWGQTVMGIPPAGPLLICNSYDQISVCVQRRGSSH